MPRPRREPPDKPRGPANSLVASAVAYTSKRLRPASGTGVKEWQREAWAMYDTVGELRFGIQWKANAVSRVKLKVVQDTDDGEVEVTDGLPAQALAALFQGESGQANTLAAFTTHLEVVGECYLLGTPNANPAVPDKWEVVSTAELREGSGTWTLDRGDGNPVEFPVEPKEGEPGYEMTPLVIRVWRPHPMRWIEADSPVRAALPILRELVELSKTVAASLDSRLTGAGLLVMPIETSFASPADTNDEDTPGTRDPEDEDDDPFLSALIDTMVEAMRDRGSASAHAPVVARVPGEYVDKIKHITFSTPLDERALDLRTEAIRRLALSLDMPSEVLLGLASSNHWSAWAIDESALKVHITPLVESVICNALTTRWLWPVLEDRPRELLNDDALAATQTYRITGDDSDLRQRPDRSSEAFALWQVFGLSDDALMRELGLDETDKPADDEVRRRLLLKFAMGTPDGATVVAAADQLGLHLPPPVRETAKVVPEPVPGGGLPLPPAEERRLLPVQTPATQAAALQIGAELAVGRAVERALNKTGHRSPQRLRPVTADKMDDALSGAWVTVPRIAALCGVDPGELGAVLDGFTRSTLAAGQPPDATELAKVLARDVLHRALGGR